MSHVFVIAEAGISHDGDLRKALTLIDHARLAKADAVKFQTFNAKKLSERRKNPDLYQKLKPYEMPIEWLPLLKDHCTKAGIEFMTTCFDEETIRIVEPFVRRFKISHVESQDFNFIEAHLEYGKGVIASFVDGVGRPMGLDVTSLYVNRKYPTPTAEVHLNQIRLSGSDGFSDHTRHVMMGSWAVAAGAKVVEVHFRDYQTSYENLDWPVSHDPSDLITYIDFIRQAEKAVYGAVEEETKKLVRPGSAPHTSHPPSSGASDPSGARPGAWSVSPEPELL